MDFINKIEIRGIIGRMENRPMGDKILHRFSVVTEHAYIDSHGEACIETLWLNVSAIDGRKVNIPRDADRGDWIHLTGRLRMRRYTDSEGESRLILEVIATEAEILPKENRQAMAGQDDFNERLQKLSVELTDLQAVYENTENGDRHLTDEEYRQRRKELFEQYRITEQQYENAT